MTGRFAPPPQLQSTSRAPGIERTIEQYAVPIYTHNFISNPCNYKDIEFQIRDDLFYETLLMMIRGETVKFSKQKTKHMKQKEKELISQIKQAHNQHCDAMTEESAFILEKYKDELENFRKPQIDGLIVRSRTNWHEDGERSSKYFLGLEKRNAQENLYQHLKLGKRY